MKSVIRYLSLTFFSLLYSAHVFAGPITTVYEFNDAGEIAGWTLATGTASVSGGKLLLGSGGSGSAYLELPFGFDRTKGDITIEADIRINGAAVGDFNIFAFNDTSDPNETNPFDAVLYNGYEFGYYPDGSDNDGNGDALWSATNGALDIHHNDSNLTTTEFAVVTAFIGSDGLLESSINGSSILSMTNSDHQSGAIALRTWGLVEIESLSVTYSVPEPSTMILLGLGLVGFGLNRKRRLY